jgi:hypothetical protein
MPRRPPRQIRRWVAPVYAAVGLGLLPWTIWLAASLPAHHETGRWDVAWSGLDTALGVAFLLTGVAAWRRSPWLEACAAATGTLLLADAWFDLTLESHTEFWFAVATAAFAEIPFAALCFWIARDAERFAARALSHLPSP